MCEEVKLFEERKIGAYGRVTPHQERTKMAKKAKKAAKKKAKKR